MTGGFQGYETPPSAADQLPADDRPSQSVVDHSPGERRVSIHSLECHANVITRTRRDLWSHGLLIIAVIQLHGSCWQEASPSNNWVRRPIIISIYFVTCCKYTFSKQINAKTRNKTKTCRARRFLDVLTFCRVVNEKSRGACLTEQIRSVLKRVWTRDHVHCSLQGAVGNNNNDKNNNNKNVGNNEAERGSSPRQPT